MRVHGRHADRTVMYFKNGFKFHFAHPRSLLFILHFVSNRSHFVELIPHYYVICNGNIYIKVTQCCHQIAIVKSSIANILRKSDQLRGIRGEQIKDSSKILYMIRIKREPISDTEALGGCQREKNVYFMMPKWKIANKIVITRHI